MPGNTLSNSAVIVLGLAAPIAGFVGALVGTFGSFWLLGRRSEHEREQNRFDRRVAARQAWMPEFSASIGSVVHAFRAVTDGFIDFSVYEWQEDVAKKRGSSPGTVSNTPDAQRAKKAYEDRLSSLFAAVDRFAKLWYLSPDPELNHRVRAFLDASRKIRNRTILATARVVDHADNPEEARERAEQELNTVDVEIRALVGRINQRVEALLEGADLEDFPEHSQSKD